MHSSIDFSVKHMVVFTVRGSLGSVSGTAETTGGELTSVKLDIDAKGITTHNAQRDGHLKSGDFFDVEQNSTIEFKSTTVSKLGDTDYTVTGDLTMAGQTSPVTVDVELVPPIKDPMGNTRSGATGSGSLHRKDWGITFNTMLPDSGGVTISDEVKFTFDIQAVATA